MRKKLSNYIAWIPAALGAIARWGGYLMDLIGLPDAANTVTNLAKTWHIDQGIWSILLIASTVLLLLIINWQSLRNRFGNNKSIVENKPQPKPNPNPFDLLAKECQDADATHIKLIRKPHVFIERWIYYLDKLRRERNIHDIENLFNLIGNEIFVPGRGNANVGMDEVLFTINCLSIRGYITLEKSDHGHNSFYENRNIKFNAKYDEFIKQIIFEEIPGGYRVNW